MKEENSEERRLESEYLHIGKFRVCREAQKDCPLNTGTLTKYMNKEELVWPRRLVDCRQFVIDLDALLRADKQAFYLKQDEEKRYETLYRIAIWKAWEAKYQDQYFEDNDVCISVSTSRGFKDLENVITETVGRSFKHYIAVGKLESAKEVEDMIWKAYKEVVTKLEKWQFLEPLRRMGRLPASELEQQQLLPAAETEHETRQALA